MWMMLEKIDIKILDIMCILSLLDDISYLSA